MMKKYIKQELLYGIRSKTYLKIYLLMVALFGVIIFMNYNAITSTYHDYQHCVKFAKSSGENVQELLKEGFTVETNGNSEFVKNPVAYSNFCVGKFIYTASPNYLIIQFMESSVLFYPIIFGILGLIIGCYEVKNKTIRLKTVRANKNTYSLSKQLSLFIAGIIISILAMLTAVIIGGVVYKSVCSQISASNFNFDKSMVDNAVLPKIATSIFILIVYSEIGYTLGVLFKNTLPGACIIAVYTFIIPNLGKYDLKNSVYFLTKKVFDFLGMVSVNEVKQTSLSASICVIILVGIIAFLVNMIMVSRRSSYDC